MKIIDTESEAKNYENSARRGVYTILITLAGYILIFSARRYEIFIFGCLVGAVAAIFGLIEVIRSLSDRSYYRAFGFAMISLFALGPLLLMVLLPLLFPKPIGF